MKSEQLKDIAEIIAGQSPPSSTYNKKGNGLPFFQGKADFGIKYPVVRSWCTEPNKIAQPNDILISVRAPVGPTNLCNATACIGRGLAAIRVLEGNNTEYVWHYLKSIEERIARKAVGSTFSAITQADLKTINIPLPDLKTQRQIVHVLSRAEELIAARQRSLALLDDFLKSTFLDLFYTSPDKEEWPLKDIKSLAKKEPNSMRTGPFGSDLLHNEFVDEGVYVLGIDNVKSNKFEYAGLRHITYEKYEKLKRYTVKPGDLLISIMGTVGRTAVVPNDIPEAINTKHLAAITLDQTLALPEFLAFSIHSDPFVLSQINLIGRGAIMTGLNLGIIKNAKIRRPPISLQTRFVEIVNHVETLKKQQRESLTQLQNLYQSLLQRAFAGELDTSAVKLPEKLQTLPISFIELSNPSHQALSFWDVPGINWEQPPMRSEQRNYLRKFNSIDNYYINSFKIFPIESNPDLDTRLPEDEPTVQPTATGLKEFLATSGQVSFDQLHMLFASVPYKDLKQRVFMELDQGRIAQVFDDETDQASESSLSGRIKLAPTTTS